MASIPREKATLVSPCTAGIRVIISTPVSGEFTTEYTVTISPLKTNSPTTPGDGVGLNTSSLFVIWISLPLDDDDRLGFRNSVTVFPLTATLFLAEAAAARDMGCFVNEESSAYEAVQLNMEHRGHANVYICVE
jgi:hypothetical protein